MPRDLTRVSYDKDGGRVTAIPKGTPKDEIKRAKAQGRVDKNDPEYDVEDARADAERQDRLVGNQGADGARTSDKVDNDEGNA